MNSRMKSGLCNTSFTSVIHLKEDTREGASESKHSMIKTRNIKRHAIVDK